MGKTCFIISSIGKDDTNTRKISDQKMEHVYEKIMKELGYSITRADKINNSGLISKDIIKHIIQDDIVIADVTDENPNVFYELAIRNAVTKPVILFKRPDQKLPFDIQDKRALSIDMTNPDVWIKTLEELKNNVKNIELDPVAASGSILSEFGLNISINKITDFKSYIKDEMNSVKQEIKKTVVKLNDEDKLISKILDNVGEAIDKEEYDKAKICLDIIFKEEPDNIEALRWQGILQDNVGEHEKAINTYNKILLINSNDDSTYFYKAMSLFTLKNNDEALQCINKAIELDKESIYLTLKAEIILDGGDNKKALEIIEQALSLKEIFSLAWKIKGHILTNLGKQKEAKLCYQKYEQSKPKI